ncbi:hypothetical protein QJS66_03395 [Kocuria rhizophila]|nr:hypothetical protein QJS66_03395 [Kocuria rhizophila]
MLRRDQDVLNSSSSPAWWAVLHGHGHPHGSAGRPARGGRPGSVVGGGTPPGPAEAAAQHPPARAAGTWLDAHDDAPAALRASSPSRRRRPAARDLQRRRPPAGTGHVHRVDEHPCTWQLTDTMRADPAVEDLPVCSSEGDHDRLRAQRLGPWTSLRRNFTTPRS